VYLDKWILPTNSNAFSTVKGSLNLPKNLRWYGSGGTDHTTPPVRMKLTSGSVDFNLKGYHRAFYVDK